VDAIADLKNDAIFLYKQKVRQLHRGYRPDLTELLDLLAFIKSNCNITNR
jgi:hypothetical protein